MYVAPPPPTAPPTPSNVEAYLAKYDPVLRTLIQINQALAQLIALLKPPPAVAEASVALVSEARAFAQTEEAAIITPTEILVPVQRPLRPVSIQEYSLITNNVANKIDTLDFRSTLVWIIIDNNISGSQDISISFDGGKNFKTLRATGLLNLSPYSVPQDLATLTFKSAFTGAPFEILTGEAR